MEPKPEAKRRPRRLQWLVRQSGEYRLLVRAETKEAALAAAAGTPIEDWKIFWRTLEAERVYG